MSEEDMIAYDPEIEIIFEERKTTKKEYVAIFAAAFVTACAYVYTLNLLFA